MHNEILTKHQEDLLPLIKLFKREFYLAGGTAIGLHIGHRRSVDFDLFKHGPLRHRSNIAKITESQYDYKITRRVSEQMDLVLNNVKLTFFQYPYEIPVACSFQGIIKLPDLPELAAMKAFALSRRSKWKDYVDLYFILKNHLSISDVTSSANQLFGQMFSEKLFRAQLCYFEDIDYSEQVEFIGAPIAETEIREFLIARATEIF